MRNGNCWAFRLFAAALLAVTTLLASERVAANDESGNTELPGKVTLEDSAIRQGPRVLRPGPLGVGRRIPDASFVDIEGRSGKLSDYADRRALVIAMTGIGCPLCKKYAPTLAELERRYGDRDVAFLFLNPNQSERVEPLREEVADKGFQGPYVRDDEEQLTRLLDVKTTTEVFVLDRARTLVYRGAVDDQYGLGYALAAPRQEYLVDALDAVLAGAAPDVEATFAPGCEMFYQSDAAALETPEVTYHNRISRIIQRSCLECHREEGVAPMPLENYQQVADYAGMIRSVVRREVMPPWFAAPMHQATEGDTAQAVHSPWANDRSLSSAEKADLIDWVEAGAPEGAPADAPLTKTFPGGWLIGEPDAVFEFPRPVPIPASGILPYKKVVVETDLKEDRWVQAIEVMPGDRGVVHHALVFVLPPSWEDERRDPGGGINYWGIYVPGNSTRIYPEGIARKIPAGSRLKFQMHYTTNGRATEDRTKVGLVFADQPPRYEAKTASIVDHQFTIPPHADNFRIDKSFPINSDVTVLGYLPHHHLRGKACRYELVLPDGREELLLDVPRYDFNWQLFYQYREPKFIPAGSAINFIGWYDNSTGNPANPDPTEPVGWGEQTDDEMHVGYIEYIVPLEQPDDSSTPGGLVERLDVNGDGELTREEVRQRMPDRLESALRTFERLDKDKNDRLDAEELKPLRKRR